MNLNGTSLLDHARGLDEEALAALAGPSSALQDGDATDPRTEARAALLATLLTSRDAADAALVRALTRFEIETLRIDVWGMSERLRACCWLLFMFGDAADSVLVWQAKTTNVDTFCGVDGDLLIGAGLAATVEFSRTTENHDLLEYLTDPEFEPSPEDRDEWMSGSYWRQVPAPSDSVERLARYLNW